MKPLIYGYMRVHSEAEDEDIRHMELELKGFAAAKGFCFATIFYEYVSGCQTAFDELIAELKRGEAHDVIVPSLCHLANHAILRDTMLTRLETRAKVWVIQQRTTIR